MKRSIFDRKILTFLVLGFFLLPSIISADSKGQIKVFFVNKNYDAFSRSEVKAVLKEVSDHAYFYIEKEWFENLSQEKKEKVLENLSSLSQEFEDKIYPTLVSFYGSEWSPGIDNDYHITVLFFNTKKEVAGFFDDANEYFRVQSPFSNEREMIYLNANHIFSEIIKSHLAHEFVHLITFNQKDRLRGVKEEVWLNEARADFAPTLLGYDKDYQGSNLQERVKIFLESPSDSLVDWKGEKSDYGVVNLFIQYLVDHYGKEVLRESLHSRNAGIASLNFALEKLGFQKTLGEIFSDWAVAVFLADCNFGKFYCYKNENLKKIKVISSLIFLPSTQQTQVSLTYSIQPWSGNWFRILGRGKNLRVKFDGQDDGVFLIKYVLCQNRKTCEVKTLGLDVFNRGEIFLSDFSKEWTSLTLIPVAITSFEGEEEPFRFSLEISLEEKSEQEEISQLLQQVETLKKEIEKVRAKIQAILAKRQKSCFFISSTLTLGSQGREVVCLQQFLRSRGAEIYPEGLVTGYFGRLTQRAVIRFQEKYAQEILYPLGLQKGTGIVGWYTRKKINSLLRGN